MYHRACVVSCDADFAQFVRLTLLTRLRSVTISTGEELPDADIYVIDLDTVSLPSFPVGTVLLCSAYLDKPTDCTCLWADRPFRPARLLALLDLAEEEPVAMLHPYLDRPAVLVGETEVALSTKEYALFMALWHADGAYLTREQLLREVWADETADEGIVNVYIHYLRRKIERNGQKYIYAARGCGYRLTRGEAPC